MSDLAVDELWDRWTGSGDQHARERLVVHYSPLVKFVVGRLRSRLPSHVDTEDLTSDGLLGLLDAMDRFDPSRGLQFQTFAVRRIRGAILDGLRAADWAPRNARDRIRTVDAAEETLSHRLGRSPSPAEVAAETSLDPAEVHRAAADRATSTTVSLDEHPEDPASLVDDGTPDAELPLELSGSIRRLPERDQVVLALYYWERLTLGEIGRVLGVSESRVSQLHSRATRRLQDLLVEEREEVR